MRRAVSTVLAICAISLSGCRGSPAPSGREVLFEHLEAEPASLDPLAADDSASRIVGDFLYTPLVSLDRSLRPIPGLAKSWTVSADGRTYEFALDPAARHENGAPVVPGDVRYTIERLRDPASAGSRQADFESVEEISEPGPGRVSIRFREPYSQRLIAFNIPIVSASAHRDRSDFGTRPVGNGPYRVERWDRGRSILLRRREESFPGASRVLFRILPETSSWVRAGLLGELAVFRIPQASADRLASDPAFQRRFRVVRAPRLAVSDVLWNCRNPLLAEAGARTALSLAIPRDELVRALYGGRARPTSGPFPAGVPENAADVPPPAFDPSRAAAALARLGFSRGADGILARAGRRFSFELLVPAGQNVSAQIAEVVQREWRKIGVEARWRALDWAALRERVQSGAFDAALEDTEFDPPNLDPYDAFHSSQRAPQGVNYGGFSDGPSDRLMEALRRESDPSRRLELFRRVHRRLAEEQPCAFLFTVDSLWAVGRDLEGVEVSPLGLSRFFPGRPAWRFRH